MGDCGEKCTKVGDCGGKTQIKHFYIYFFYISRCAVYPADLFIHYDRKLFIHYSGKFLSIS